MTVISRCDSVISNSESVITANESVISSYELLFQDVTSVKTSVKFIPILIANSIICRLAPRL